MSLVSAIIPSRNCQYTSKTVDDIFNKAKGEIEVIVVLDNYWPSPPIKEHPNLTVVHKGVVGGMRHSLNLGASIAKGEWLMKCDDHCMFAEGFDEILLKDMEKDWLVNPSRYSLDAEKWKIVNNKREAVEYLFLTYPYAPDSMYGSGLHGKKWIGEDGKGRNMGMNEFYWKEHKYKDLKIDDMMTFQGSFWLMSKEKYWEIGGLDEKYSDLMENEPQELGFKVWLSGGRCIVNKNTWYAHMHKNERELDEKGRSWKLSYKAMREASRFQTWYWMNDKWPLATRNMRWFVEHFWPIPGWPENWEEEGKKYYQDHPEYTTNFRIFNPEGIESLKWI